MYLLRCGKFSFLCAKGTIGIGLFHPPLLRLIVSSDARLPMLATRRERCTFEKWVGDEPAERPAAAVPFRIDGFDRGQLCLYGSIVAHETVEWLGKRTPTCDKYELLVYQRMFDEGMLTYLERLTDKRLAVGELDHTIAFPRSGGCLLRPTWLTNEEFISLFVSVLRTRDSRIGGWRILYVSDDTKRNLALVLSSENPMELDIEKWAMDPVVRTGADARYVGASEQNLVLRYSENLSQPNVESAIRELCGRPDPEPEKAFGVAGIPTGPGWVRWNGRRWFVREVRTDFDHEAGITEVVIELSTRAPSVDSGGLGSATYVLEGIIEKWDTDKQCAFVSPRPSGNPRGRIALEPWRIVKSNFEDDERGLGVVCATPAMFAGENNDGSVSIDAEGGVYLRMREGDSRIVVLYQGSTPYSPGAALPSDAAAVGEDAGFVMRIGTTELVLRDRNSSGRPAVAVRAANSELTFESGEGIIASVDGKFDVREI